MFRKFIVILILLLSILAGCGQSENLGQVPNDVLFDEAQGIQMVPFNSGSGIQKRIFEDGLYPVSDELWAVYRERWYTLQFAETLDGTSYGVYYMTLGNWVDADFAMHGDNTLPASLETWMYSFEEEQVVLRFEPSDVLQKAIIADGYVPNSDRFRFTFDDRNYIAQRAEVWRSNRVKIYYLDLRTETVYQSDARRQF